MSIFKIEAFLQLGNDLVPPEVGWGVFIIGIVKGQLRILHELFPSQIWWQ